MQTWKFLLYGITGDLSKKKILPALAQFADFNQEEVEIQLIGYSRSNPDTELVKKILDENTTTKTTVIENISYVQGDYSDSKIFFDFISNLQDGERLVTYLAIPPELFLDILKNSCPFSSREIDLIIEKPFGRNLKEAQQMLQVMEACDLHQRIHFSDHYLFKTSTFVNKYDWMNFSEIKDKTLDTLEFSAIENLDVKDRGGYYNDIGALKDIFVHLFSLLNLALSSLGVNNNNDYSSFKVKNLIQGQYQSYLVDLNLPESDTDTYFHLSSELIVDNRNVNIIFESGKKLGQKNTNIKATFTDGSVLNWNIAPDSQLEYNSGDDNIKSINLAKNQMQDHTNLFKMLLDRDMSRFVDSNDIVTNWEMFDKVIQFKEDNKIETKTYKDDTYPPVFN